MWNKGGNQSPSVAKDFIKLHPETAPPQRQTLFSENISLSDCLHFVVVSIRIDVAVAEKKII